MRTREEFKKEYQNGNLHESELIDELYDYFESRTCENCRFRNDYRKCPMENYEAMADTNYCYNFMEVNNED